MRMASAFLFFAFVFASQFLGGLNTKLPPPSYGNVITILSIDGGGIKGIIPSVILQHLENALKAKDKEATLAGYFDVIAGTSTGGIFAGLLTTPHPSDLTRPAFNSSDALNFYLEYGPSIFNRTAAGHWDPISSFRPKFDGVFLHNKSREIFGETRLNQTLTNVVIPTFDVKKFHKVIFTNYKLDKVPSLNAKLSDICLGTSAAPTLLPPYYFRDGDNEFNLVDGGLTAGSPALVAVSEVVQQKKDKNPNFISLKENEHTKILLLSIGTGVVAQRSSYDVETLQRYNALLWTPAMLKIVTSASIDMNDYHLESVFTSLDGYYLRVQEYNLDPSVETGGATEENMAKLVEVGEDLLGQTVKTMNITSYLPEEKPSEGTNAEAIERFVEILFKEKRLRLKRKSMEKMGQPFIDLPHST